MLKHLRKSNKISVSETCLQDKIRNPDILNEKRSTSHSTVMFHGLLLITTDTWFGTSKNIH
jgi:hypothetical protein